MKMFGGLSNILICTGCVKSGFYSVFYNISYVAFGIEQETIINVNLIWNNKYKDTVYSFIHDSPLHTTPLSFHPLPSFLALQEV